MKGIEKLIKVMAQEACPRDYGFKDVKRECAEDNQCVYGDGKHLEACVECFKASLEIDYEDLQKA